MNYFILITLGVLPCVIWLFYFIKEDKHPEPNRTIIKVFILGMIAAYLTLPIQIGFKELFSSFLSESTFLYRIIYVFIIVAFVEEIMKFLIVKYKALNDPEFDEPVDVMIYMITAALGFAAVENILYLKDLSTVGDIIFLTSLRFVGAILLHALCSAAFGYFIALSFFKKQNKLKLFFTGLLSATILHGLFNSFIMIKKGEGIIGLIFTLILLVSLMIFVSKSFKKLNKLKSISLS